MLRNPGYLTFFILLNYWHPLRKGLGSLGQEKYLTSEIRAIPFSTRELISAQLLSNEWGNLRDHVTLQNKKVNFVEKYLNSTHAKAI